MSLLLLVFSCFVIVGSEFLSFRSQLKHTQLQLTKKKKEAAAAARKISQKHTQISNMCVNSFILNNKKTTTKKKKKHINKH